MCAKYQCGMDAQRRSVPSTAVVIRKAIALYQPQSAKNVCAARAQSRVNCGLKVLTRIILLCIQREKACAGREVRFVRCGVFQLVM